MRSGCITRDNNLAPLRSHLADHPLRERIHLHGVDLPGVPMRAKRWGTPGMQWYYDRWQQRALDSARQLDHLVGFDVVHHATFASYWARTGLAALDKPLVWGPVGGAVEVPRGWWATLGARGAGEEALRLVTRRLLAARPVVRRTMRRATVVIAQNGETAARIGRARSGPVTIQPNASAVGPLQLGGRPLVRGTRRGVRRTAGPMEGGTAGDRRHASRHPCRRTAAGLRLRPRCRQVGSRRQRRRSVRQSRVVRPRVPRGAPAGDRRCRRPGPSRPARGGRAGGGRGVEPQHPGRGAAPRGTG